MKNKTCNYRECKEPAIGQCEVSSMCDHWFCEDHGSRGGDRGGGCGDPEYAVPSACWNHGGFNADE